MDPETIRKQSFAFLAAHGFRAADWLPMPEPQRKLRPAAEIAGRLMGLAAVFIHASAPEEAVATDDLRRFIERNRLRDRLTAEEDSIVALPRNGARASHADSVGWKLENMWPLAWVLGFEAEPTIEASQIDMAVGRAIIVDFLGGTNGSIDDFARGAEVRPRREVVGLEDRFYCAHNAVRSAQLGEETVPEGFDPVAHGGVVHERRHALTWCLSPGISWSETDLST
jgi:hypothetical protein